MITVGLIWLLIIPLAVAGTVFWIVALVDCVRRDFPGGNDKLMWVLIILIAQVVGALVYWFVGRERGTPALA